MRRFDVNIKGFRDLNIKVIESENCIICDASDIKKRRYNLEQGECWGN
jgi:hypothetical protein